MLVFGSVEGGQFDVYDKPDNTILKSVKHSEKTVDLCTCGEA